MSTLTDADVRELDFGGWPLPDPYLLELGRVSALWTSLDSTLNLCIGKLAGFNEWEDPTAFILINHSSFPQRIDILCALCDHLADRYASLSSYQTAVEKLRIAQRLRNKYIHNAISENPENDDVVMAVGTARGKVKVSVDKVTVADLRRTSVAIFYAMGALHHLVLGKELRPPWEQRK